MDPSRARFLLAFAVLALVAAPVSARLGEAPRPAQPAASGLLADGSADPTGPVAVAPAPSPGLVPVAPDAVLDALLGPSVVPSGGAGDAGASTANGNGVHVTGAPAPVAAPSSSQTLTFRCPSTTNLQYVSQAVQQGMDQDRTVYGCPFRVYDAKYHFGSPQVVVNPADEREIAFFSLHGAPAANGPTPRSRTDLTHTTFTTDDQGLTWTDQPTSYGGGGNGLSYLGEGATGAMDSLGNLYAGYLWSLPNGNATTGYAGLIGLYKGADATQHTSDHLTGPLTNAYTAGHYVRSRSAKDIIGQVNLVDVLPRVPPQPDANFTLRANGTVAPPAQQGEIGQEAAPVNRSQERVAAVWFERAVDWRNSTTGFAGWIDAAVTKVAVRAGWERLRSDLNATQLIGPCMDASNAVAWNGLVYVLCEADNGYHARNRARVGDLDLWALDPLTGNTTLVSFTGLRGGHPILAVTPDGYFAVLSTTKQAGNQPARVEGTFGWYGTQWLTSPSNMGPTLHHLLGDHDTFDIHVNALAVTPRDKTIALVYMEWQRNRTQVQQPDPTAPPPLDPQNPSAPTVRLTDFQKSIVTFNECSFPAPIAAAAMQLGTGIDPQNLQAYQERPSMFDDDHDGLAAVTERSGDDVLTFAVNDYGAMQVGSVVAGALDVPCALPIPPANLPPPALAQALSIPNPAILVTGSLVAVGAAAMVTYLLTVKRRVAHFALAEA